MSTISTDYTQYLNTEYLSQNPQIAAMLEGNSEFASTLSSYLASLDQASTGTSQDEAAAASSSTSWDELTQNASIILSSLFDSSGTASSATSELFLPSRVIEAGYEPGMEVPEGMWLQTWNDELNKWVDDDSTYRLSENGEAQVSSGDEWVADSGLHRLVGEAITLTSESDEAAAASAESSTENVAYAAGQDPPEGMIREYWDEVEGRWRPDLQPHQVSEDGAEQYFANGAWQDDTGLHRWAVPTTESVVAAYDTAQEVAVQFYDPETGQWEADTCPHRVNDQGVLEYFNNGQWLADNNQHRVYSEEQGWQATTDLGLEQILASSEVMEQAAALAEEEADLWSELVAQNTTTNTSTVTGTDTSDDAWQNYTDFLTQTEALEQTLQV